MKRFLSLLLVFVLIFTFAACGSKGSKKCVKHDYIRYVVTKPTCQAEGEAEFCCSVCGHTYTEKIDKVDHEMLPVNCALPERCSMCTLTKGEPAGHNFQGSGCNNCNTYQSTKLAIPALPFTIANVDGTVKAEITAVDYVFYNEYVYIRFSGKKTYDAQNGGKNAISVPITLKNTINNTVHSKVTLEIKDLAVGDKFENVLLTMDGVDQLISDYAFFY